MPTTTILPLDVYPTGSLTIGPANIADGLTKIVVSIARCTTLTPATWTLQATTVYLKAEISINNGPFTFVSGMGAAGGIVLRRNGSDATESTWEVIQPPGINRRLQVLVEIANGPLVTSLSVVTE